MKQYFDI